MDRDGTFKNRTRATHHENGALEPLPWTTPLPELYDPLTNGARQRRDCAPAGWVLLQ